MTGCNKLISADENFKNVEAITLPKYVPYFGYSSLKFVPGSDDNVIVALLTEEYNGTTTTLITAFTDNGEILLEPMKMHTSWKNEGIEFL